jgi:hypothetical protein
LAVDQALADLIDERQADLFLHLLDLHGDRRLAQIEIPGRPRHRSVPRHRFENLQLAQGDMNDEPSQDRFI